MSTGAAALGLLCAAQFMVVLDISIVNVALPSIQRELGMSAAALQGVVTAYALTFGGFLLLGGRAADLYGRRRLLIASLLLFAVASLAGGLAQSGVLLVAATMDAPPASVGDPPDLFHVDVGHVAGPVGGDLARLSV